MENKESFFARITPNFSCSEECRIRLAYYLAKYGHRAQVRKESVDGKPLRYFEHIRRVAINVMDEAKIMDSTIIVGALLHDMLEDAGEDMTPELLEFTFGSDVVSIVKKLSKVPKEGYIERLEMCTDWRPLLIKACDRLDNLRSLMILGTTLDFQKRQVKETREKYLSLFDKMAKLTPPEHRDGASHIRDEILKMVERCATMVELKEAKV
jgi:(p)ppGpp synthase/HD superfamily hydrolase